MNPPSEVTLRSSAADGAEGETDGPTEAGAVSLGGADTDGVGLVPLQARTRNGIATKPASGARRGDISSPDMTDPRRRRGFAAQTLDAPGRFLGQARPSS